MMGLLLVAIGAGVWVNPEAICAITVEDRATSVVTRIHLPGGPVVTEESIKHVFSRLAEVGAL